MASPEPGENREQTAKEERSPARNHDIPVAGARVLGLELSATCSVAWKLHFHLRGICRTFLVLERHRYGFRGGDDGHPDARHAVEGE